MFNSEMFDNNPIDIPKDCDVVFVSDFFVEDYAGGAELTTQVLIDESPENIRVHRLHSQRVTGELIQQGYNKFWVFGNFAALNLNLIPEIVKNLRYSILEYDYKFCKYRSIERHLAEEGNICDCHEQMHGKFVSAFFHAAHTVFWMSEEQMIRYTDRFPFLLEQDGSKQIILSSIFDRESLAKMKFLKEKYKDDKKGWVVLGTPSWIKGTDDAIQYCESNDLEYEVVSGLTHEQTLVKLAQSEGFVYLPRGGDTCPRMVIEAQLLGCKLEINEHVQHQKEFPFTDGEPGDLEIYLGGRAEHFWINTINDMDWVSSISGYTTTYNCIDQGYPFIQSIKSMLGFCQEVVVMDGGSSDGTFETLIELSKQNPLLKVYQNPVDWKAKRSAVEDGLQKARARKKCVMKYCWQMDCDEIVHEDHYEAIVKLCRQFPKFVDLISLPVIEYWGSTEKVRMDINPWKWRLSRNKASITHGIPGPLRKEDENGNLYATPGTDGCDYIDSQTLDPIAHANFYTPNVHEVKVEALVNGNEQARTEYETWFNKVVEAMPCVYHYSWFDLERKIKTYKGFWQRHWASLYDIQQEDTPENNMFFDKSWADVTNDDIKNLAQKLSDEMGGWIFHKKVDFTKPTPFIRVNKIPPAVMNDKPENTSSDLQLQS